MIFIKPSIQEIYEKFANNDEIVNYLKENNMLVTRSYLIDQGEMGVNQKDSSLTIRIRNKEILYHLAEVLDKFKYDFTSKRIYDLALEGIGFDEIAIALRKDPKDFSIEAYKKIIFTYKYCSISSFFQNNRDSFMPEYDFLELGKNESAKAFYDAMMKEFDKLDCILSKCCEYLDFDKIPWDMITYLTQLLGFEKSTIDASMQEENKFRELAKNILDIYRIKGTNYSFELFFNFLGFNLEMREFYFDRRLYYNLNSGGNQETDSTDMYKYEFYLTNSNPINNDLKDIGTDEIVGPEDISPQYSLHEFEELCTKYGPAAVLGYSPVYNVCDEDTGEVIETKVYEDKVYKYFKTNLIYYNVSLPNSNPNAKQIKAITKYLDFLTPSYVMRTIKIDSYEEKNDEEIGFDGDGEKKPDGYGNFNGFEMLDGEDWNHEFEDKFTRIVGEDNKRKIVNEGHYSGIQETYKEYTNSIGKNEFRQPIDYKVINKSTSRFLTNASGVEVLDYKRLNYYVVNKIGDEVVDYPKMSGVAIYPYYTIPPYVANDVPYFEIKNRFNKQTKNVDLLGYLKEDEVEEGEKREKRIDNVKTQIKMANIIKPIDFITNDTISDFVKNNKKFSELYCTEILNRVLIPVQKYSFGDKRRLDMLDCYIKDLNVFNISNIDRTKIYILKEKLDKLIAGGYENNKEAIKLRKEINDTLLNQSFTNMQIVNMPTDPNSYKNLTYGDYVVSLLGNEDKGEFVVYRFGNPLLPIKFSNTYKRDYKSYIDSFNYKIVKDYNGSIIGEWDAQVGVSGKYITKNSLSDIRKYVNSLRELMIKTYNDNASSPDKWFDINYITDLLFLNKEDNEYYRAVKCPKESPFCISMKDQHIFKNMQEAEEFFKTVHPERRVCNTEFFITNEDKEGRPNGDPSLYTFAYRNRPKETLIYSTKDEVLYYTTGNSIYDIKPAKQFYGNLSIYKEDENGKLGFVDGVLTGIDDAFTGKKYSLGICEDESKMYAEINQYDSTWEGYDELADRDDFIFYNHYNNIRPIKSATDREFEDDLKNSNEFDPRYIEEGIDLPKVDPLEGKYDKVNHYYRTIAQNLIRDITSKTIDNFTSLESINWEMDYIELIPEVLHDINPSYLEMYERDKLTNEEISKGVKEHPWKPSKASKCDVENKEYSTHTHIGILSIIEGNLEKATGKENRDREYDYYAKASNFLQDYYRIIIKNNFETKHFPISFVRDMFNITDLEEKVPELFNDEQIEEIKKRFRISILQIASILENISRNRIYYSLIGRWSKMADYSIRNEDAGVWTLKLKEYCPKLDKLWRDDPFSADPLNPIFFKTSEKEGLEAYFKKYEKELGNAELFSYELYRDNVILSNETLYNNILKMSNRYKIMDKNSNFSYPLPVKTSFARTIDNTSRLLKRKYSKYIKIEGGAKEELLGKDAYSLNGQHVYDKGEIYSYKKFNYDGSSYVRNMELNFGLTCDSNGDFYLPYNLNYGLQKYSIDEYGKHREIYSEFTEMLDLFYESIYEHSGSNLDSYLKQYYYSYLLRDYREKEIKDDQPLGLSISGKKPARIYPKLTETFNGKAGTFLSKSTLLSSYNNDGGYDDTNIKLGFSNISLIMDKYKTGTLKFAVSHKDFMAAFGYDYNDYYKYLTIRNLGNEEKEAISEEINKMYKKQFACIRPVFLFKETKEAKEFYSDKKTLWQKIRNNFSKDYPYAEARACDKNGYNVTDKDGYIIDENGNRYLGSEVDKAIERFKDSFINGFIEIKITDNDTFRSLFGLKEIDDFIDNSEDNLLGIINPEEKKYVNGYLSIKELRHSFMDNYISFPQSLDWIERDENNIAKEYYSFGDDRSVNITKRNVYFSTEESERLKNAKEDKTLTEEELNKILEEEKLKEIEFRERNFKKLFSCKEENKYGYISLHDEEVIEVSKGGYPIDENGKEIFNYDKTVRFEDQGIKPKYKKVAPARRLAHSDGFLNDNYLRYGKVLEDSSEKEISIPFDNCSIVINENGETVLKVPSEMLHTSKIKKIKIMFSLAYVILNTVRRKIYATIYYNNMNIIRRFANNIKMLLNINSLARVLRIEKFKETINFIIKCINKNDLIRIVLLNKDIDIKEAFNIKKIINLILLKKDNTKNKISLILDKIKLTSVKLTSSLFNSMMINRSIDKIIKIVHSSMYNKIKRYLDIDKINSVMISLFGEIKNTWDTARYGDIKISLSKANIFYPVHILNAKIKRLLAKLDFEKLIVTSVKLIKKEFIIPVLTIKLHSEFPGLNVNFYVNFNKHDDENENVKIKINMKRVDEKKYLLIGTHIFKKMEKIAKGTIKFLKEKSCNHIRIANWLEKDVKNYNINVAYNISEVKAEKRVAS